MFIIRFKRTKIAVIEGEDLQKVSEANELRRLTCLFESEEVLSQQFDKAVELETLYCKYIQLLQTNTFRCVTEWSDSYNPSQYIQDDSIHYEISCTLYNLAVLQFYLANMVPEARAAVDKTRQAIFTIGLLEQNLPYVKTSIINRHTDLCDFNIVMILEYCKAFAHKALFDELQLKENSYGTDNLCAILVKGAKCYKLAIVNLVAQQNSPQKIPPLIYDKLYELLYRDQMSSQVNALVKLGNLNYSQRDDLKDNHMGHAVGFMRFAQSLLDEYNKTAKNPTNLSRQLQDQVAKLLHDYEEINKNEYKQTITSEDDVKFANMKIQILPKDWTNSIKQKQNEGMHTLKQQLLSHKQKSKELYHQVMLIFHEFTNKEGYNSYSHLDTIQRIAGNQTSLQALNKLKQKAQKIGVKLLNLKAQFEQKNFEGIKGKCIKILLKNSQDRLEIASGINKFIKDVHQQNQPMFNAYDQEFTSPEQNRDQQYGNLEFKVTHCKQLYDQMTKQIDDLTLETNEDFQQLTNALINIQNQQIQYNDQIKTVISEIENMKIVNRADAQRTCIGLNQISDWFLNVTYGEQFYDSIAIQVEEIEKEMLD